MESFISASEIAALEEDSLGHEEDVIPMVEAEVAILEESAGLEPKDP